MTCSSTGSAKFQTAEFRSRKNGLSSMATRRRPRLSAPGGASGASGAGWAVVVVMMRPRVVVTDEREVDVLEAGPVDREPRHLAAEAPGQLAHDARGLGGLLGADLLALLPRHGRVGLVAATEPGRDVAGDDATAGDHRDAVGQHLGLVEVVGREHDRGALVLQAGDEAPELAACLGVETGGRLVQEEQLRAADDAECDVEASALPAGEVAAAGLALLGEADPLDDLVGVAGPRVVAGEVRRPTPRR